MKRKTTRKSADVSRQTIRSRIIKMAILIAMVPLVLSFLLVLSFPSQMGKKQRINSWKAAQTALCSRCRLMYSRAIL